MNTGLTPSPNEEDISSPLQFCTAMLIIDIMNGGKTDSTGKPLSGDAVFELASKIALTHDVRRYLPGKPIAGSGGEPAVDWILSSSPFRKEAAGGFHDIFLQWAPGDLEVYLSKLIDPLALWVMDLPASESNHHSYPYGLLDHALEVGLASTLACAKKAEHEHIGGDLSERAWGHRIRLAARLGLFHDVGKVFSVEVRDKKSGDIWDPMNEPLAYFKARHELPILGPTPFQFVEGRGLNRHEEKGKKLLSRLIHPETSPTMSADIALAYDAYAGRYDRPTMPWPVPLPFIVQCVHEADGVSANRSQVKGSKPGEYLLELIDKTAKAANGGAY